MDCNAKKQGLLIAQNSSVTHLSENKWRVSASANDEAFYADLKRWTCTCKPDKVLAGMCMHIYAVVAQYGPAVLPEEQYESYVYNSEDCHPDDDWLDAIEEESAEWSPSEDDAQSDEGCSEDSDAEKDPVANKRRKTYPQNWSAYNKAQTNEKALSLAMLSDLVDMVEQPEHTLGRPSLIRRDAVFACAYKIYELFSTRRFHTDLEDAAEKGYITDVPHFNTLNKYLNDPTTTKDILNLIAASANPLASVETSFAIDSSGFSTKGRVSWYNRRWGKNIDNREWIKVHIACGTKTNIITSASVSGWNAHDTNYFAPLLEKTAKSFDIRQVSADRAYLSHANLDLAWLLGAHPFIPFKSNTVPVEKDGTIWAAMYDMYTNDHQNWKQYYHQRSNVESAFSMVKDKFGEKIMTYKPVAQVNEALYKILCHNVVVLIHEMFDLGIVPSFATGKSLKARIVALK